MVFILCRWRMAVVSCCRFVHVTSTRNSLTSFLLFGRLVLRNIPVAIAKEILMSLLTLRYVLVSIQRYDLVRYSCLILCKLLVHRILPMTIITGNKLPWANLGAGNSRSTSKTQLRKRQRSLMLLLTKNEAISNTSFIYVSNLPIENPQLQPTSKPRSEDTTKHRIAIHPQLHAPAPANAPACCPDIISIPNAFR